MKKLISLVLALAMIMMVGAAMAGTITITPPTGVDSDSTNVYNVYKVFDAVASDAGISYKLVSGKTTAPAGFSVDAAGNVIYSGTSTTVELTADDIAAIKDYVTAADIVATVTADGADPVTTGDLGDGYFFIDTTTGTTVTVDSTTGNISVNDKNTVPEVDKKITGASSVDEDGKKALAQVGTAVNYSAEIIIGKGAKDYVFHDTMETGLTYNEDVDVTPSGAVYTSETAEGDTFTLAFDNDWIKTLAVGSKITITYSATVDEDAITLDPLNNTAYVSYGDSNGNNRTPDTEADVYEAKFTVEKKDGEGNALKGAGFVIANADGKYYTLTEDGIVWVESIDAADEHFSDEDGHVASFTGLANGTYTLIEKTVPAGYNKAADSTFTIAEHNYTADNLEQESEVTNNAGTELPSTGGIGTTIFYILGGLLVVGAAVILVARRKAQD